MIGMLCFVLALGRIRHGSLTRAETAYRCDLEMTRERDDTGAAYDLIYTPNHDRTFENHCWDELYARYGHVEDHDIPLHVAITAQARSIPDTLCSKMPYIFNLTVRGSIREIVAKTFTANCFVLKTIEITFDMGRGLSVIRSGAFESVPMLSHVILAAAFEYQDMIVETASFVGNIKLRKLAFAADTVTTSPQAVKDSHLKEVGFSAIHFKLHPETLSLQPNLKLMGFFQPELIPYATPPLPVLFSVLSEGTTVVTNSLRMAVHVLSNTENQKVALLVISPHVDEQDVPDKDGISTLSAALRSSLLTFADRPSWLNTYCQDMVSKGIDVDGVIDVKKVIDVDEFYVS